MDGIHLLGEWYGCAADSPEMTRVQPLRTLCLQASEASGMTIVGDSFHQFEPAGVTGTVLLAESHLAIHTWPEHGFVTIDVYVCNYTTDNSAKAERLLRSMQDAMKPQRVKFQVMGHLLHIFLCAVFLHYVFAYILGYKAHKHSKEYHKPFEDIFLKAFFFYFGVVVYFH